MARAQGLLAVSKGDKRAAQDFFQKCIDITPTMVAQLIEVLKQEKVKYVVAPYEADAQLVYLEKNNITTGIVSEDSDLLVFGAQVLVTKLNDMGDCIVVSRKNFGNCSELPLADLSQAQLRAMAIFSGCDYSDGIPKIGLKVAHRMIRKYTTGERALRGIRLEGYSVPADFEEVYEQAELTFLHQRVYCLKERKLIMLNESDMALTDKALEYIGRDVDAKTAEGIALGWLDPFTKKPISFSRPAPIAATPSASLSALPRSSNMKITSFFSKAGHSESSPALAAKSLSNLESARTLQKQAPPTPHSMMRLQSNNALNQHRSLVAKRAGKLFENSKTDKTDFVSKFFEAVKPLPIPSFAKAGFAENESDSDIEELDIDKNKENSEDNIQVPQDRKISLGRFAYQKKKETAASVLGSLMDPKPRDTLATPLKKKAEPFANPFVEFDSSDGSDFSEVETPEKVRAQKRAMAMSKNQPTIVQEVAPDESPTRTPKRIKNGQSSPISVVPRCHDVESTFITPATPTATTATTVGSDMKVRVSLERFKYNPGTVKR